jgi:hypothetical protein
MNLKREQWLLDNKELIQSLRDNIDSEEVKQRNDFNNTQYKKQTQRREQYRYLKSGY